jgi:hypothetical protein
MRDRPRALGDDEDMGNLVQQKFRTSIQAVDLKECDLLGNSGVGPRSQKRDTIRGSAIRDYLRTT